MKEKELERLTKIKEIEKDLYSKGFKNICGIDEAGRGPLAGPVVVAGVIMPQDSMIEGINDSKKVMQELSRLSAQIENKHINEKMENEIRLQTNIIQKIKTRRGKWKN